MIKTIYLTSPKCCHRGGLFLNTGCSQHMYQLQFPFLICFYTIPD